jgi:hypothetical protein
MDPSQLTPQQAQAAMMQVQQKANHEIMEAMMKRMVTTCFTKCAGTSVCLYSKMSTSSVVWLLLFK